MSDDVCRFRDISGSLSQRLVEPDPVPKTLSSRFKSVWKKLSDRNPKVMTVSIAYNRGDRDSMADYLLEILKDRAEYMYPNWDIDKAMMVLKSSSKMNVGIASGREDIWYLYIYAAEYIRKYGSTEQRRTYWLPETSEPMTADEDRFATTRDSWGGVEDDWGETQPVPVREQMQEKKVSTMEAYRGTLTDHDLAEIASLEAEPELMKWAVAEKIAHTKARSRWEGKLDWEMEQRVKYCYGWLREVGNVPKYPDSLEEVFRPYVAIENSERANEKRLKITEKVMKFFHAMLKRSDLKGINLYTKSYRAVLAAQELEALIEHYATNYRRIESTPQGTITEEMLDAEDEQAIKQAAVRYFNAHLPVQTQGSPPGPLSTIDPGYVEYIQLCRKYGIKEGQLLHEVTTL